MASEGRGLIQLGDTARAGAREILAQICDLMQQLNTPQYMYSRVEIEWTPIPQVKVIPADWTGPVVTAHWCEGGWHVDA